jgi:hypothetical protein
MAEHASSTRRLTGPDIAGILYRKISVLPNRSNSLMLIDWLNCGTLGLQERLAKLEPGPRRINAGPGSFEARSSHAVEAGFNPPLARPCGRI